MAEKRFVKINSIKNDDGNAMFDAICSKVLKVKPAEAKELLGISKKEPATTVDVIQLLQNLISDGENVSVEICVTYEPKVSAEEEFDVIK